MTVNPFPRWLNEIERDVVVIQPDDINAEARGNLWSFGLSKEQRRVVTPSEVEEFIQAVVAARARWLEENRFGRMRFYCWYDAQAGQLRFSLVSAGQASLPFARTIVPVSDLIAVVRDFLSAVVILPPFPLPVWVTLIP